MAVYDYSHLITNRIFLKIATPFNHMVRDDSLVFTSLAFLCEPLRSQRLCVENPLTSLYLACFFSKIAPLLSLVNSGAATPCFTELFGKLNSHEERYETL